MQASLPIAAVTFKGGGDANAAGSCRDGNREFD